MAFLDNVYPEM